MADRDENYGGQKTRVVIIKIENDSSICIPSLKTSCNFFSLVNKKFTLLALILLKLLKLIVDLMKN